MRHYCTCHMTANWCELKSVPLPRRIVHSALFCNNIVVFVKKKSLHHPGLSWLPYCVRSPIEPEAPAWQAEILPLNQWCCFDVTGNIERDVAPYDIKVLRSSTKITKQTTIESGMHSTPGNTYLSRQIVPFIIFTCNLQQHCTVACWLRFTMGLSWDHTLRVHTVVHNRAIK